MKKINKKELHEIFQNLIKKDQNAYNKLYENYYKLVYGIVFSIIKNKDDSEDITHEIFTKIYKLDVAKLPTSNEASWLFTVSKNECFLYLRKSKPNINLDEIYEIPESSNDIDKIIDVEYYNKLLNGLKEDEKLIVSLKVLSNFTFSKISQVMNVPIGTVQWKYYNAINSLKISVSSLAGAVIAFIIVLARGELLNNKQYLNENTNLNSNDKDNDESIESDDEIQQGGQDKVEENETTEEETKNENVAQDSIQNSNQNSNEIESITKPDNSVITDKNDQTTNDFQQVIPDCTTSCLEKISNKKIDEFQVAFTALGIVCLIIFTIFFKIYQQKLRKKSSK